MLDKVAVVGAGYIAVELAGMPHSLGADVSLIIRRDAFLREFDTIISTTLTQTMLDIGLKIINHTDLTELKGHAGSINVTSKDGGDLGVFDTVLWAIGRRPLPVNHQ